jgi:hypothetical protein
LLEPLRFAVEFTPPILTAVIGVDCEIPFGNHAVVAPRYRLTRTAWSAIAADS